MSCVAMCVDRISTYRNPITIDPSDRTGTPAPLGKLLLAEIGYIVCIPFALVSTALLGIAALFSLLPGIRETSAAKWVFNQFADSLGALVIASILSCVQLCGREKKAPLTSDPQSDPQMG